MDFASTMEVCGFFFVLGVLEKLKNKYGVLGYSRKCFTCVFVHKCEVFKKMIGLEI